MIKNNSQIKYIFWSVETEGTLGIGIFKGLHLVKETADYITWWMKLIFPNRGYYSQGKVVNNHGNYIDITQS